MQRASPSRFNRHNHTPATLNSTALALVICGALLHAIWNLLAKKASGGLPFIWLYGVVSITAALPFGVASWLDNRQQLTAMAWTAIFASALIHAAYSVVLQKGYRASDFSVVYPVARGSGPLFSVVGAVFLLGENPSGLAWLGIFSVLLGITLISGALRALTTPSPKTKDGLRWGMLTGLFIAGYSVVDGWAIKALGIAPVLYYVLGLLFRTIALTPSAWRMLPQVHEQWHRHWPYIIGVGILSPLAYTLVLLALTQAPLSYVAPVRELSMLAGVLLGAKVLRETFSLTRLLGTLCMVAGVVLLTQAP